MILNRATRVPVATVTHGEPRTTTVTIRMSLVMHQKTSLLTVGDRPLLCWEVLRCGLTAEQYFSSVSR